MLRGFDGAAARRPASVDATEARKERRWIIRESLYSRRIGSACPLSSAAAHPARRMVPGGGMLEPGRRGFVWTPDYTVRLPASSHRAAASALSWGTVLKAIAAPGAAL